MSSEDRELEATTVKGINTTMQDTLAPNGTARPLLKWAGGKTQLLPELQRRLPQEARRYFEPFIGGGALFFTTAPLDAVISDLNGRLINFYNTIRNSAREFALVARELEHEYNSTEATQRQAFYYERRNEYNGDDSGSLRDAALFLFLNKAGFNGLYRENSKGHFNVPFGHRPNLNLFTDDALTRASIALQRAEIRHQGFEAVEDAAEEGDFVYFDPPYVPLEGSPSFTSYLGSGFGPNEQELLASVFERLAQRGVNVMLSNSDTTTVRSLYQSHNIHEVSARRNINSVGSARGSVGEVIVTSY